MAPATPTTRAGKPGRRRETRGERQVAGQVVSLGSLRVPGCAGLREDEVQGLAEVVQMPGPQGLPLGCDVEKEGLVTGE